MSEEQITNHEAPSTQEQQSQPQPRGITRITVQGFKSLRDETSIEIRPLTILAGANSSGKSSIMQPLLLMKQTLEAPYDPGPLKLDGPNVYFTSAKQFFSLLSAGGCNDQFSIRVELTGGVSLTNYFILIEDDELELPRMILENARLSMRVEIKSGMSEDDLLRIAPPPPYSVNSEGDRINNYHWGITRDRSFLGLEILMDGHKGSQGRFPLDLIEIYKAADTSAIHVPRMRKAPERNYRASFVLITKSARPNIFAGTFDNYVANVIRYWQADDIEQFDRLLNALGKLGLTDKLETRRVSDVEIELRVGRLPKGSKDLVNIADVGFGVSQVLPVVVALLVAEPGQLVYIEQPELHLHPDAQARMAELLADAARRGVRVVVETHSDILLLAVQTLVAKYAENKDEGLDPSLVKLHWFSRDDEGVTHVQSADLDEAGTFGEWPEDFGQIRVRQMVDYLTYSSNSKRNKARQGRNDEKPRKSRAGKNGSRQNGQNGHSPVPTVEDNTPELEAVNQ